MSAQVLPFGSQAETPCEQAQQQQQQKEPKCARDETHMHDGEEEGERSPSPQSLARRAARHQRSDNDPSAQANMAAVPMTMAHASMADQHDCSTSLLPAAAAAAAAASALASPALSSQRASFSDLISRNPTDTNFLQLHTQQQPSPSPSPSVSLSSRADADGSPTLADLFSSENQPRACSVLLSPAMPAQGRFGQTGGGDVAPAPSILSPVLPPAQGFAFRNSGGQHGGRDDSPDVEDDMGFQQQPQPQSHVHALQEAHEYEDGSMQQSPEPAAAAQPCAASFSLRASSLGISPRTVPPPPPSMPPLPSWCGLPQSMTNTKRMKTTPLSSPASSRAPRLVDPAAASSSPASAASSVSAALPIAAAAISALDSDSNSCSVRLSPFQFDSPSAPSPRMLQPAAANYLWELQATPSSLSSSRQSLAPLRVSLWSRACWLVGRHTSSDILLDHISISRLHARLLIHARTGRLYVQDLGSTHGTFVDGVRVADARQDHGNGGGNCTPDALTPGTVLLEPGCVLSFGASSRTYTLVQHKEQQHASEHARVSLSLSIATDLGGILCPPALPSLRKSASDGSLPPSPAHHSMVGSTGAAAAASSPDTALSSSSGGGCSSRVPGGTLLHTSASVSSLADVRRRDRNFQRKRKNVSFAADAKKIDGAAPSGAGPLFSSSASSDGVRRGTLRTSLKNGSHTPGGDGPDGQVAFGDALAGSPSSRCREISASFAADRLVDSPVRPKRQGMTAEDICLQRQMAAAAAAIPVPILRLPTFNFAPRAFSAPPAPAAALAPNAGAATPARVAPISHLVATPSASPPAEVACFPLTSPLASAVSASASTSSPSASFSSPTAMSTMAGATCSKRGVSGGDAVPGVHTSAAFSVMQQPQHRQQHQHHQTAQQRHPALGKHARDPSADGDSVRMDTYCQSDDVYDRQSSSGSDRQSSSGSDRQSSCGSSGEDRQSSSGSDSISFELMSASQRATAHLYEQLLPQAPHLPASPASFTSLSLASGSAASAAASVSFPHHPTVAVPVHCATLMG